MTRKQSDPRPAVSAESVTAKHRTSRPRTPKTVKSTPVSETETSEESVQPTLAGVVSTPGDAHEEIARIAYSYWEARGRQHGFAEQDWVRAEAEYRSRFAK